MNFVVSTRCLSLVAVLSIAALGLAISKTSSADDRDVEHRKVQLPERVRNALKAILKDGETEKVEVERDGEKELFEVEAEVPGGKVELKIDHKGAIVGIEVINDGEREADDSDDDADEDDQEEQEESEEEVAFEKLPDAAKKVLKKKAGDADIDVTAIKENGTTVYEAEWSKGSTTHELTVTSTGDVLSSEKSLTLKQLPVVLQKLAAKFGNPGSLKIERKSIVLYELEVTKDGKEVEIYTDALGRVVELEASEQVDDITADESHEDDEDDEEDDND